MNWLLEYTKRKFLANEYKNDKRGIAYILFSIKKGETIFVIGDHKAGYLSDTREITTLYIPTNKVKKNSALGATLINQENCNLQVTLLKF